MNGQRMLKVNARIGLNMGVLLMVSEQDIASVIQGEAVLGRSKWIEIGAIENCRAWKHFQKDIWIWWIKSGFLFENNLDSRFSNATGENIREVIFLSRHFAASGMPSLTLHVIGVPGEIPHGEEAEHGGIKGRVVQPNPRFADWYRLMCKAAVEHDLVPEFDLTIETTHHGPILDVPTMFVEIGSSESHWNRRDAAEAWADVIVEGLGLDGGSGKGDWSSLTTEQRANEKVMVGIGGGHYAPRHSDVMRKTRCWAGHQLAGYSLPMEKPTDVDWDPDTGNYPVGAWKHSIETAIISTRLAFEGSTVMAHLDRKSFKGWQRRIIHRLLNELEVPVGRTVDFE